MIQNQDKIKIHAGCGTTLIDGWINIDHIPQYQFRSIVNFIRMKLGLYSKEKYDNSYGKLRSCHTYFNWDLRKPLPFKSNSVTYIYSEHLIEHFEFMDALRFFQESFCLLIKGGIIRTSVPDIHKLAKEYLANNIGFFKINLPHIDLKKNKGAIPNNYIPINDVLRSIKTIGQLYSYHLYGFGHKWGYDYSSLEIILKEVGFSDVKERKCHESKLPDIEYIEQKGRSHESIYVEAVK